MAGCGTICKSEALIVVICRIFVFSLDVAGCFGWVSWLVLFEVLV